VRLSGVHEIDAYGFQNGKSHGLAVFNYGLHQARRVSVDGPGLSGNAGVSLWRIISSGPGDTNEETVRVRVKQEPFDGRELVIAPCSMVVVEWQE
jgi:hypothetical protein